MGVAKTVTHMREKFAERFYKQPTELPPDYTELQQKFNARSSALESAVRMSKQTFGFRSGAYASQTSFGDSLINYGAEFDDEEPLSYGLCKVGELQERLAANQETFETISRANYIAYWTRLLESDVAVARRAMEKVEKRRLEFDSCNTGRDRQGFFEIRQDASAKYMESGRNLQSAIEIAKTHMQRVLSQENETQLQNLLDFVAAQGEYYRACLEEVDRIKMQLQGKPTWRSTGEAKPLNRATRRVRFFTAPPQQMPMQAQTQIYRQPTDQRREQLVPPLTTLLMVPPGGQVGHQLGPSGAWVPQQSGPAQLQPIQQVYSDQAQQSLKQSWPLQGQQEQQQQQPLTPGIGGAGIGGGVGQQPQPQIGGTDMSFVPDSSKVGRENEAEWNTPRQPESNQLAFGQATSGRETEDVNFAPSSTGIIPMTSQSGVDSSLRGISSAGVGGDTGDVVEDSIYGQGYGQRYAGAGREKTYGQSFLGEGTAATWKDQEQGEAWKDQGKTAETWKDQGKSETWKDQDRGTYGIGTPAAGGDLQTLGSQGQASSAFTGEGVGMGGLGGTEQVGGITRSGQQPSMGGISGGEKEQQIGGIGSDAMQQQQQPQPAAAGGMSTVKSSDVSYGRALYDFSSRDESNLQFKRGDIVRVIKHYPQGWAYGDIAGHTGFFPASYVKELV